MVLHDLWLLNSDGTELYHSNQSVDNSHDQLITSYFKGLQQFSSELGGSQSYSIENELFWVIGRRIACGENEFCCYLVGQFERSKRLSQKKCETQIQEIEHDLLQQQILNITDIDQMKLKVEALLKKLKIKKTA